MKLGKYTLIGLLLDAFDWLIIGMVPILGDVVDFFASIFWYSKLGPVGFAGLIELIPFVDILPTNIALGYIVDQKVGKHD